VSGLSQEVHSGVTVLFSRRPEDADERILQLIRADGGRSQFVIVSNDNYIFNNARVHGARVISVAEFYAQLQSVSAKPSGSGRPKSPEKSALPTRDAQQITEEYRRYLEGRR
jgi:predicted RNA-binding protein with PIN domain